LELILLSHSSDAPSLRESIEFEHAFRHFITGLKINVRDKVKEQIGFEFTDFPILFLVQNGKVYPKQIREATRMSASMVSHMIDRTLKAKLIERQIDEQDSRKIRLNLTSEGERILSLVNDTYHQFILDSGVSKADLENTTAVLKKLVPQHSELLEKK
jgi:DNA-binding MarR family transcriptional regulator